MKRTLIGPRIAVRLLVSVVFGAATPAPGAGSAFESPWTSGPKSQSRLISAGGGAGGTYRAGIQIRLSPRTVTYWRTPGDAGTPPVVSFVGSMNLASAELSFPAPRRIDEDGIEAFGYQDDVVFPLRLTAADPKSPVALHVTLDYAACEKICIPMHVEADLVLSPGEPRGPFAQAIAAAAAKVPVRQPRGEGVPSVTAVRGPSGDWAAGKGRFTVDARVPVGGTRPTLFAEGPAGWYLQPATADPKPDGSVTFDIAILQAPPGAEISKAPFVLTLVAGDRAIEVPVRLDSRTGTF